MRDVLDVEKYLLQYGERIQKKHFDLVSFTHPFLIYPQIQLEKPEDILNFMGKMLVANHYVEEQFVSEVLNRDKYSSTRVAPGLHFLMLIQILFVNQHFQLRH